MEQREAQKAAAQRPSVIVPASNYKDKYEHLIGKEAAKDAAKITLASKAYGFGMCIFTYSIKNHYGVGILYHPKLLIELKNKITVGRHSFSF